MASAVEFRLPVRVYIEDTDAGGIVYYVNYLKFMERARTELVRHLGFDRLSMIDNRLNYVVHSADVRYLAPARIDDALWVSAEVTRLGKAYIQFTQRVVHGDSERLLCQASIKVACVADDSGKPKPLPAPLHQALAAHMQAKG